MNRHALFLGILAFSQPLVAADLLQTYRDARANDPVYASARATRDAGRENLPQGLAQLLPNVSASAFTQMNYVDVSFRGVGQESTRDGNTNGYNVSLTQPLFNWQSILAYREAGYKVAQAEAAFGQVAQDLVVRVAQAYFDVLASQDSLAFILAQKTAISEQLAQAKRNF
jgi:outer membrane protein